MFYLLQWKPFKKVENYCCFILKSLFLLRISKFLCSLFDYIKKWVDRINFKIDDVKTWLTNNYNTYIAQYLMKWKQPDHEIWSGNFCFSKIMQKMTREIVPVLFLFFKSLYEVKEWGLQLSFYEVYNWVLTYFNSPQLGVQLKQTV